MARIPLATAISLIAGTLVLSSCSSNPVDIDTADEVTNAVHNTNTANIPAATEDDIEIIDLNAVTYTKQGQIMTLAEKKAHNERRRRQIASQRTAQKQDQQTEQLRRIRQKEWEARQQSYHDKWQRDQAAKKNQARVAAAQRQREQEQKRQQQQAQAAQQRAQAAQRAKNAAYEREQEQIRKRYHARYQQEQARKRQQQQRAAIPRLATPANRVYQPPRASTNSRPMASAARPQNSWMNQWAERLSQAALERTRYNIVYNGRYEKISYPWGDVSPNIGVCTDVVIRSYRKLGIDLQRDVHEDMKQNFMSYPRLSKWKLKAPDPNIDHRRVYNLQAFFNTNGEVLPITNDPRDYKPGDLVTWNLFPGQEHIGIVVNRRSPTDPNRYMMVHNIAEGPKLEDVLFQFRITGHYRYYGRGV